MRLRPAVAALAAAFVAVAGPLAASAPALVSAPQVTSSDVVVESGAPITAQGVERFRTAAADLAGRGTPVKFVVLETKPGDSVGYARSLRHEAGAQYDVLVLSP